jgi:hypothetical protein
MMSQVRTVMIGCGGMARHHIRNMIKMQDTTQISVVCEPSSQAYEETAAMFEAANLPVPANQPDLDKLLSDHNRRLSECGYRCVARKTDGDEWCRSGKLDCHAQSYWQVVGGGVPRQPIT